MGLSAAAAASTFIADYEVSDNQGNGHDKPMKVGLWRGPADGTNDASGVAHEGTAPCKSGCHLISSRTRSPVWSEQLNYLSVSSALRQHHGRPPILVLRVSVRALVQ